MSIFQQTTLRHSTNHSSEIQIENNRCTSATTIDLNLSATRDNSSATRENGSDWSCKRYSATFSIYGASITRIIASAENNNQCHVLPLPQKDHLSLLSKNVIIGMQGVVSPGKTQFPRRFEFSVPSTLDRSPPLPDYTRDYR